ncbi:MAG: MerR family transcriptional regulator [Marinomonas sp.]
MNLDTNEWRSLESESACFPIRTLSTKTGVNSVTLRAWERRYGLLKPKRTEKGHRLYNEADVIRVESIVRWIQQGVAVSKVRALLDQDDGVDNVVPESEWLEWQSALVAMSLQFDEDKIEHLYKQIFSQYPSLIAIQNWVLPALKQLGSSVHMRFCEAVLARNFANRLSTLKGQNAKSSSVLISALAGQGSLWCYMASAILNDHGLVCRVYPNMLSSDDLQALIKGIDPDRIVAFCDSSLIAKSTEIIEALALCDKPVSLIGASFWVAAHGNDMTHSKQVRVYSEAVDGVLSILEE